MARSGKGGTSKRRTTADAEDAEDADVRPRRSARDTVDTLAHVLRHRDRIVSDALHLLEGTGWLEPSTRERVWAMYQRGDTRTRFAMQELVARTLRVPLDKLESMDGLEEDDVDLDKIDEVDLDRLRRLSIPTVDPERIGRRLRELDVERFLKDDEGDEELGFFSKLLTETPVKIHKLRLELLGVGLLLLLLVAAALVFPTYAQLILFYGLLALTALLGIYLIRASIKIDRAFKEADLELGVLVKLRPKERRLLILRRLWLRFVDTSKFADTIEHMLHTTVPDMFLDDEREEVAQAARARHKAYKTQEKAEEKADRKAGRRTEKEAGKTARRQTETPARAPKARGTATKRVRARVKRAKGPVEE